MDQELDNNKIDFKDKIFLFFKKNKLKILIFSIVLIIFSIFLIIQNILKEKENNLISEKYVQAGIYLASGEKEKSFQIFEEIIISKNNFYSVLALNTILEKELTKNKEKILGFFEIIEQLDIDQDRKDLILFKKALYLLKSSDFETGNKLLKKLIESNSKLKIYAEEVLDN